MPQVKRLAAAVLVALLIATGAHANVTAKLVLGAQGVNDNDNTTTDYAPPSPQPSAGAIVDDPALSNYKTYDLQITLTNNTANSQPMDFISAGITFKVTTGNFYQPSGPRTPPFGGNRTNSKTAPGPDNWFQPDRYREYDTWVATKKSFEDSTTYVAPTLFNRNSDSSVANLFDANNVDVQWGDLENDFNATGKALVYSLGRFTVLNGSKGFLTGFVTARDFLGNQFTVPISIDTTAADTFTPEPTSLGLLGIAAGFMLRRPKRRVVQA